MTVGDGDPCLYGHWLSENQSGGATAGYRKGSPGDRGQGLIDEPRECSGAQPASPPNPRQITSLPFMTRPNSRRH